MSCVAIPFYACLPAVCEKLILNGYTKVYEGWSTSSALFDTPVFLLCVELGIYWVHRALHASPRLFGLFHATHHSYTPTGLTPFAGMAFQPLDGLFQGAPYLVAIFVRPIHAVVFEALMFATGIWTAFIHLPNCGSLFRWVLGPAHHRAHHKRFNKNFGQYTVLCDYLFGTLCET